jgi:hypothetical protein
MFMLLKAKDIAKNMSGKVGSVVTQAATMAGGLALGAATGGTALLARGSLGRLSNVAGRSDSLSNLASGKTASGEDIKNRNIFTNLRQQAAILGKKTATAGSKGSWDIRQTGIGGTIGSATGMNFDKGTNLMGLNKERFAGGYQGKQERKLEAHEKFKDTLGFDKKKDASMSEKIESREEFIKEQQLIREKALSDAKIAKNSDPAEHKYQTEVAEVAKQNILAVKSGGIVKKKASRASGGMISNVGVVDKNDSLDNLTKAKERNLVGRQREFDEYKRKQSGRIVKESHPEVDIFGKATGKIKSYDTQRDEYGNIKKYAEYGKRTARQASKQILKEFASGLTKGGALGAGVGVAATIAGAPIAAVAATAIAGGVFNAVRSVAQEYSGTTNRRMGEASAQKTKKEKDN